MAGSSRPEPLAIGVTGVGRRSICCAATANSPRAKRSTRNARAIGCRLKHSPPADHRGGAVVTGGEQIPIAAVVELHTCPQGRAGPGRAHRSKAEHDVNQGSLQPLGQLNGPAGLQRSSWLLRFAPDLLESSTGEPS